MGLFTHGQNKGNQAANRPGLALLRPSYAAIATGPIGYYSYEKPAQLAKGPI